jgi:hypothetical protein
MLLHNYVFQQQIWSFFCNDLQSCLAVAKEVQLGNKKFKGGLNFTAALAIFSVIDFLASFWKGKQANQDDIAKFIYKYFAKYHLVFSKPELCKQFYNIFRNGLSHQWSPKLSGVAMDFSQTDILLEDEKDKILHLNIPAFYEICIKAFKDYENDLDSNPNLSQKFDDRYNNLIKSDEAQSLEYFKNLLIVDAENM